MGVGTFEMIRHMNVFNCSLVSFVMPFRLQLRLHKTFVHLL